MEEFDEKQGLWYNLNAKLFMLDDVRSKGMVRILRLHMSKAARLLSMIK